MRNPHGHRDRGHHRYPGQGLQHHLVHRDVPQQRAAPRGVRAGCRRGGDNELAEFFRKAQTESRKGAEQGKQLLAPARQLIRRGIDATPPRVTALGWADAGPPRRRHLRAVPLPLLPRQQGPGAGRHPRAWWASCLMLLEQGATHVAVATDHVIESFRNDLWAGLQGRLRHRPRPEGAVPGRRGRAARGRASRCGRWSSRRPTTRWPPAPRSRPPTTTRWSGS